MRTHTDETKAPLGHESLLLKVDGRYCLEKLDPSHRRIDDLRGLFVKMNAERKLRGEILIEPKSVSSLAEKEGKLEATFATYLNNHPTDQGVTYLNKEGAQQYRVKFLNGRLCDNNDKILSTFQHSGKQPGYAAFVLDKEGSLYSHEHVKAKFHHSSTVNGDDVLSAGMIQINQGKVEAVNTNSGHYKPNDINLALMVYLLDCKKAFQDPYAGRNWFVKKILTFLAALGLYQPDPLITHTKYSSTLCAISERLMNSNFLLIYLLGRLLGAFVTSKSLPLNRYREEVRSYYKNSEAFKKAVEKINTKNEIRVEDTARVLGTQRVSTNSNFLFSAKKGAESPVTRSSISYVPSPSA